MSIFNPGDVLTAARCNQMFTLVDSGSVSSGTATTSSFAINSATLFTHFTTFITCRPLTAGANLLLRTSTNGTSFDSSSGNYQSVRQHISNASTAVVSGTDLGTNTAIMLCASLDSSTAEETTVCINLYSAANVNQVTNLSWIGNVGANGNSLNVVQGAGKRNSNGDVNGLQFLLSSGNFQSAVWTTYGW